MARSHRTAEQWQALFDKWRDSGRSATRFCEEHGVGYASFCHWRKRLAEAPSSSTAPFVDLSALTASTGAWRITLSLGNGVELRLNQV